MCALIAWVVLSLRYIDMLIIGEYSSTEGFKKRNKRHKEWLKKVYK